MANEQKLELLLPVGRLVQGHPAEGNTKDFDGNPLVYKNGDLKGQPRVEYFFAVALPKNGTTHWSQTEWGAKIWAFTHQVWPGGDRSPAMRNDFAWKIEDGDSTTLNKRNKRPCDYEGFPGHWVVRFSGSYAPKIVNANGSRELNADEIKALKCGDYVQPFATIKSNGNQNNPGIYINHECVAHSGYGDEIRGSGIDAAQVGFGQAPLPAGASATPLAAMPAATAAAQTAPSAPTASAPPPPAPSAPAASAPVSAPPPPAAAQPTPPPNTGFTANAAGAPPIPGATAAPPPPPPAAGPQYVMTGSLGAFTREQAHAANWTDELLLQHGHMRLA